MNDLRYALRTLARSPGFTLAAVVTLALGIGANTAVFSVVEGVLLRSLPFPGADRLRLILSKSGTSPLRVYETWRTATGAFEDMAAARGEQPVMISPEGAERVTTWTVTANFFPMLGGRAVLGRTFLPEEDRPGSAPVAVLSYAFWQSHFGGDRQVLGRTVTLDTVGYTIVGVMSPDFRTPAGFRHPDDTQLWRAMGSFLSGPSGAEWARQGSLWVFGRLRPGTTSAGALAALNLVSRRLQDTEPSVRAWIPVVEPLHESLVGRVRTPLLLMLGAVSLVLLVACANVASLLLSRGVARAQELAVRVALGASRARLVREALTESVLLALAGGGCGVLLALWTVPVFVRLAGADLPHLTDITVNIPVLAAALGASVCAGLAAGLIPGLRASRQAPADALKAGSRGARGGSGQAWRQRSNDALIVAQLALTMVLLSGAGLLTRSFVRLVRLDPGFDPTHVAVAELRLPRERYPTSAARAAFVRDALQRLGALPSVAGAAVSEGMPFSGYALGTVGIPGRGEQPELPVAHISAVSPDYFRTLAIPLIRGQTFDRSGAPAGVIIDEAAARAYFPGADPIGRQITFYTYRTRTIIGIVGDVRQQNLHDPPPPHIYEFLGDSPPDYLKLLVRTSGTPLQLVGALRQTIRSLDPRVPVDRAAPFAAWLGDAMVAPRLYTLLLASFAVLALALAATGVYGIAAYAVTRRTREIGIRVTLGAGRAAVLRLVVAHGLALTLTGVALGVVGALATTQVLRAYLFEVGPRDPVVLLAVGLVVVATTLVASYVPARRATKIDPMVALRSE